MTEQEGRTLMVCDIEGAERQLFEKNSAIFPDDLIVEIHDFKDPGLGEFLRDRLMSTHHVRFLNEETPPFRALRQLHFVSLADTAFLADEGRPVPMRWLIAEKRFELVRQNALQRGLKQIL